MKSRVRRIALLLPLSILIDVALLEAGISVLNGLSHEQTAEPGGIYEGLVSIVNLSDSPAAVRVYQSDYSFSSDGTSLYDDVGSVPRSNGTWVTFGPSRMIVEPHGSASIRYTVTVPDLPDLVGTYWSLLMVEEVAAEAPLSAPSESTLGIQTVIRYAVQLATHIGTSGREDFRLTSIKLRGDDPSRLGALEVDLENIGERMIRADLRFELFDSSGQLAGTFFSSRRRTYPMTSVRYSADLSALTAGAYKVLMILRLASGSIYASEYSVGAQ